MKNKKNWVEQRGLTTYTAARRMFNTSAAFMLSCNRCREMRYTAPDKFEMLLVPAIVNAAFSLEITMKAIYLIENGNPYLQNRHRLNVLYNSLSDQTKKVASGRFATNQLPGIQQILDECADAFVEWRYVFEAGDMSISLEALVRASDVLLDILAERLMEAEAKVAI